MFKKIMLLLLVFLNIPKTHSMELQEERKPQFDQATVAAAFSQTASTQTQTHAPASTAVQAAASTQVPQAQRTGLLCLLNEDTSNQTEKGFPVLRKGNLSEKLTHAPQLFVAHYCPWRAGNYNDHMLGLTCMDDYVIEYLCSFLGLKDIGNLRCTCK